MRITEDRKGRDTKTVTFLKTNPLVSYSFYFETKEMSSEAFNK